MQWGQKEMYPANDFYSEAAVMNYTWSNWEPHNPPPNSNWMCHQFISLLTFQVVHYDFQYLREEKRSEKEEMEIGVFIKGKYFADLMKLHIFEYSLLSSHLCYLGVCQMRSSDF